MNSFVELIRGGKSLEITPLKCFTSPGQEGKNDNSNRKKEEAGCAGVLSRCGRNTAGSKTSDWGKFELDLIGTWPLIESWCRAMAQFRAHKTRDGKPKAYQASLKDCDRERRLSLMDSAVRGAPNMSSKE